jgi:hypothetical protein
MFEEGFMQSFCMPHRVILWCITSGNYNCSVMLRRF